MSESAYRPLSNDDAIAIARDITDLFDSNDNLLCEEIGDGNLNFVFRVYSVPEQGVPTKSIIIKQALPYAKVVGESWPLSLDRARIEHEALTIQGRLVPDLVPQVYAYHKDMAYTIMEDLSDHTIMRKGLIEGNQYAAFADHISRFLANTLFYTSDLGMNQQDKKRQVERFINPDLCKITEDLIFDDPYTVSDNNNINPAIMDEHEKLCQDASLHIEVMLLRDKFLTQSQALLHGDLHTGSIFVTEASTKVIDPEFAYYGPMGFDIGAVFANLLLNAASHEHWTKDHSKRDAKRDYLIQTIKEIWNLFHDRFLQLWHSNGVDRLSFNPAYQEIYMKRVLQDAAGYAGCKVIRRVVGLSHVADIDTIADAAAKERAERLALAIGTAMVKGNREIQHIDELIDICQSAFKGVHTS
ncbi:S-methyl-5-thioribose kinase [Paenibacillus aquistagni]|uniref:S-methyl-5-thioribose kinase n=1 Tax=Paenibacillus aquistagni TaxID=1852522 RepID=UPI000B51265E|nr:S-methyl-5-thioribose kinase [Paenibacillus aquistagni]